MDAALWPQRILAFAERFAQQPRAHWEGVFQRFDACVSPVLDLDEAQQHPHNVERRSFVEDPDGRLQPSPSPRFSRTPGSIRSTAPEYGAHTRELVSELGWDAAGFADLRQAGAFGELPEARTAGEESPS